MPHQLIIHLHDKEAVHQFFRVRRAEERTTKDRKPFLDLVLGDKSGTIRARVWSEALSRCPGPFYPGDDVGIQGTVNSYNGELQLIVSYINSVAALTALGKDLKDYDPDLLELATPYDRQELWGELTEMVESLIEMPLKQLVQNLLVRYKEDFLVCPAARVYHHPYLGGLLEHTWFVARHTLASLAIYPNLNRSLALAGAILHDLGKIKELTNPQAPELTVPGQLLGHIALGWEMVRAEARDLEFPDPDTLLQLEHIILAHHGAIEFGSPVLPKTREALLVYFLDDLDAKLKMMESHLESDSGEGDFTSYHRVLQRGLYKSGFAAAPALDPDE